MAGTIAAATAKKRAGTSSDRPAARNFGVVMRARGGIVQPAVRTFGAGASAMRSSIVLASALGLALISATSACATPADGLGESAVQTESSPALAGTGWHIVAIGDRAVSGDRFVLSFTADRVSGRAGCNSFSGPYSIDGGRLAVGAMMMTRMACANVNGPEGVDPMAMERQATQILSEGARIASVGADMLELTAPAGTLRLRRADRAAR
ncbi:hypothetical protein GCM10023232_09910 [Sphingosinicella ginsenosidimutans]